MADAASKRSGAITSRHLKKYLPLCSVSVQKILVDEAALIVVNDFAP